MDYLPIFIDLRSRACLVVGGGKVALRKAQLLREAGAHIRIVAPEPCELLETWAAALALPLTRREYSRADLDGIHLVVAATDSVEVNARVASEAQARAIPVNVVDSPALCSFIMPAVVDRSPVLVGISTAGSSPVLARLVREQLEAALPASLGRLARFAAEQRAAIQRAIAEPGARRRFWEQILDGEIGALVLAGRETDACSALAVALTTQTALPSREVALIAVGDGNEDRLTLGAARWLGRADALLHESDVSARVLAHGRREAERIDIGMLSASGGWPLQKLAEIIRERALTGERVCLLRGGDPYEHGAGEEELWLRSAGLRVIVLRPAPM